MRTGQKSHLHPSALTINDLNPGRTVVRFNRHLGAQGTFVIMKRPVICAAIISPSGGMMYVVDVPPNVTVIARNILMVKLRNVATGESEYKDLTDLGVVRRPNGLFNKANFVVDYRKQHLLPAELEPRPRPSSHLLRKRRKRES